MDRWIDRSIDTHACGEAGLVAIDARVDSSVALPSRIAAAALDPIDTNSKIKVVVQQPNARCGPASVCWWVGRECWRR